MYKGNWGNLSRDLLCCWWVLNIDFNIGLYCYGVNDIFCFVYSANEPLSWCLFYNFFLISRVIAHPELLEPAMATSVEIVSLFLALG